MSRIGRKPVAFPGAVKVDVGGGLVKIAGPKGQLQHPVPTFIDVAVDGGRKQVTVARRDESKAARAMHGTMRALIANMVKGVSEGYSRSLEVYGTGYSVKVDGKNLALTVGFANPVLVPIPAGVNVQIDVPATRGNDVPAKFTLVAADKQVIGQFARTIKDVRPPEPYQGKGIRYAGEQIRRKQGKAFAGGAGG